MTFALRWCQQDSADKPPFQINLEGQIVCVFEDVLFSFAISSAQGVLQGGTHAMNTAPSNRSCYSLSLREDEREDLTPNSPAPDPLCAHFLTELLKYQETLS